MAIKFLLRRGNKAQLPALAAGEPGFTLDEKKLYIGASGGNVEIARSSEVNRDTYLWWNASFYSPFATQVIPMNLTVYDTVVIDFCFNSANAEYRERIEFIKNAPAAVNMFGFEGQQAMRYVFLDDNGIFFGTGSLRAYNAPGGVANDLCMVPIRIWGRKMGY